jgi:hypothetical protein
MENMVKFIVFPSDKRIPHSDHLLLCNSDAHTGFPRETCPGPGRDKTATWGRRGVRGRRA